MRTFLFGILLGAVGALLYAPQTGNRTRSLVRDKLDKWSNDASDFVGSKSRDLSNRVHGATHEINKAVNEFQPKVQQAAGQAKQNFEQAKRDIAGTKENVEERTREAGNEFRQESA